MNAGNAVALLFGVGFVTAAWFLFRAARRASEDRRFFRLGAYSQMVVLFFAGVVFILIGLLR
jgi:hypothetical protein